MLGAGADASALNGDGKTPADLLLGDEKNTGARLLLLRASAWSHRGWAIMLRKRPVMIGGGHVIGTEGGRVDLSGAIEFLMMVPEDGVFRVVVSFL